MIDWQPIETAPRNEIVLLCHPGMRTFIRDGKAVEEPGHFYFIGRWDLIADCFIDPSREGLTLRHATHWARLTPPGGA